MNVFKQLLTTKTCYYNQYIETIDTNKEKSVRKCKQIFPKNKVKKRLNKIFSSNRSLFLTTRGGL